MEFVYFLMFRLRGFVFGNVLVLVVVGLMVNVIFWKVMLNLEYRFMESFMWVSVGLWEISFWESV